MKNADVRTRTENLLITNQLLCQLSHIGLNFVNVGVQADVAMIIELAQ